MKEYNVNMAAIGICTQVAKKLQRWVKLEYVRIEDVDNNRRYIATNGAIMVVFTESLREDEPRLEEPVNINFVDAFKSKTLKAKMTIDESSVVVVDDGKKTKKGLSSTDGDFYDLPIKDWQRIIPKNRKPATQYAEFASSYVKILEDLGFWGIRPKVEDTGIVDDNETNAPHVWEKESLNCDCTVVIMPIRVE